MVVFLPGSQPSRFDWQGSWCASASHQNASSARDLIASSRSRRHERRIRVLSSVEGVTRSVGGGYAHGMAAFTQEVYQGASAAPAAFERSPCLLLLTVGRFSGKQDGLRRHQEEGRAGEPDCVSPGAAPSAALGISAANAPHPPLVTTSARPPLITMTFRARRRQARDISGSNSQRERHECPPGPEFEY